MGEPAPHLSTTQCERRPSHVHYGNPRRGNNNILPSMSKHHLFLNLQRFDPGRLNRIKWGQKMMYHHYISYLSVYLTWLQLVAIGEISKK